MDLIHTLLFMIRQEYLEEDMQIATRCLKSLENSAYKTVVIYNQGSFNNEQIKSFVKPYSLNCIIIGDGVNVGTSAGRQRCFEYIWANFPNTQFISEIHLDMIFTVNWEVPLIKYLENHEEPLICSGIIDDKGNVPFLGQATHPVPTNLEDFESYLQSLKSDKIVIGFTNPCIHVSEILKQTGGYNTNFLKGMHAFEDDSMLLGYYYYYGTKASWKPKINFNSVVYHKIAGQRLIMTDIVKINYFGLVDQYGAMGLNHLSELHNNNIWQHNFFNRQFEKYLNAGESK